MHFPLGSSKTILKTLRKTIINFHGIWYIEVWSLVLVTSNYEKRYFISDTSLWISISHSTWWQYQTTKFGEFTLSHKSLLTQERGRDGGPFCAFLPVKSGILSNLLLIHTTSWNFERTINIKEVFWPSEEPVEIAAHVSKLDGDTLAAWQPDVGHCPS